MYHVPASGIIASVPPSTSPFLLRVRSYVIPDLCSRKNYSTHTEWSDERIGQLVSTSSRLKWLRASPVTLWRFGLALLPDPCRSETTVPGVLRTRLQGK